jgi:hypothetical protein
MFSRIVSTASPFAAFFATLHYGDFRSHSAKQTPPGLALNGDKAPIQALLFLNAQHSQHQEGFKQHFSLRNRAHVQDVQTMQNYKTLLARYPNVFPHCATFETRHQEHKIAEDRIIASSAASDVKSFSGFVTFKTSRGEYKVPKDRLIALSPTLIPRSIRGSKEWVVAINTNAYDKEMEEAFFTYLKSGSYDLSKSHEQLFRELFCLALELFIASSVESSEYVTFKTSHGEYKVTHDCLKALNPKFIRKIPYRMRESKEFVIEINTKAYDKEVEEAFFSYLKSGSYNLSRPQEQLFDELFCLALEFALEFEATCNRNRSDESRNQTYSYNGDLLPLP